MDQRFAVISFLLLAAALPRCQVLAAETFEPVSMSAKEFSQLPKVDQRDLLVRVFRQRLEHARNLEYSVDLSIKFFEYRDGKRGAARGEGPFRQCRQVRLGDSYRLDSTCYPMGEREPSKMVCSGYDAQEGIGRCTVRRLREKNAGAGRIQTTHDKITEDNNYNYWLDGEYPYKSNYLFPYLLDHQDEFEIEAPIDGEMVQLTVPFQPWWAEKPGGKRVLVLDSRKGFLPVRGDSRWDAPPTDGHENARRETFVVEEDRLVAGVWMPIKISLQIYTSAIPGQISVDEMRVTKIEYGKVTPADLVVPFTEGMRVVDAIKGVHYVVDAKGNPVGKIEPVMKSRPVKKSE